MRHRRQLAAALYRLTALEQLHCSGRVVLAPLGGLTGLTRLQELELTQDMQVAALRGWCAQQWWAQRRLRCLRPTSRSTRAPPPALPALPCPACTAASPPRATQLGFLGSLHTALPHLTQLAVGRVSASSSAVAGGGPAAHAAAAAALQQQWPPLPAAAAAPGQAQPQPAAGLPPGALAAAGAAGGGAAGAAAAAADAPGVVVAGGGAGGEVMLEDVGAIVDGLIGNLQEGGVPGHLLHIIERFESLIQVRMWAAACCRVRHVCVCVCVCVCVRVCARVCARARACVSAAC
jgi:hypothetical protein